MEKVQKPSNSDWFLGLKNHHVFTERVKHKFTVQRVSGSILTAVAKSKIKTVKYIYRYACLYRKMT
jgi:hypothetical protein